MLQIFLHYLLAMKSTTFSLFPPFQLCIFVLSYYLMIRSIGRFFALPLPLFSEIQRQFQLCYPLANLLTIFS